VVSRELVTGLVLAAILAALLASAAIFRPDRAIRVATGLVAHNICSKAFVSGLDPQTVFSETTERAGIRRLRWGLSYHLDRIGQFVEAKRARFKDDMKREEMTPAEQKFMVTMGRLGYLARGVTFTLVGWFVFQAGLHRDPAQARGYSGAFVFLLSQPYGHLLLGIVALGFIALGLHSFAAARWMRLLGSRR